MVAQAKKPPLTVSNPWWGHDPSDKQLVALWGYEKCPDLFYGGAAGPGKTSYLLMAAAQYVQYPHYRALLLRKTYADLSLPDAIMDRAISWWDGVEGARFSHADKTCYFPSGARVQFGYMASARDHLRYQGAAVHFVGIDEASQIPSRQLEYLHSRIRRAIDDPIPLRYRLASNPGDVSHDWLKDTYVNGADGHEVVYLPGLMTDNPGLDVEEYRKQLAHLDPVTRKQLEEGDWDVQLSGGVLDVTRLKYYTSGEFRQRVRYWDFAATEQKEDVDPDWTAGVLMAVEDGAYQVQDVQRFREGPAEVEARVRSQAEIDGPSVPVRIEEEPGSAGKIVSDHYARHVLQGRDFRGVRSSGNKAERARPLAAAISNGLVSLRSEASWVRDLVNEMRSFPLGTHDDQVDSMSGAMTALTQQDRVQSVLPRSMVQLCVDAHRKYEREIGRIVAAGHPFVGLSVAETGADRTSMVTRIGPVIMATEQWDETVTHDFVPSTSVLHFRYAPDPSRPWRGNGPIEVANLAGRLSAETVRALAEESSGPVGRLLVIPVDGADATVEGLKADIKNAAGRVALLETGDWDAGGDTKVDLRMQRFGAEPPASLVELVDVSSREVYAACGFNAALWGGSQAASVREAWRLALFGVLSPLGRLVESELQDKLEDTVTLSWQELRASDLSGRARAFQSMVGGGMAVAEAVSVAGLMVED